jgi:hypothetical protein
MTDMCSQSTTPSTLHLSPRSICLMAAHYMWANSSRESCNERGRSDDPGDARPLPAGIQTKGTKVSFGEVKAGWSV